jgi:AbrB family looped-hinge helix DNA binding protein
MAKVTSKYQVTVPKRIAEEYGIRPGDEIAWVPAGDAIRVIPSGKQAAPDSHKSRLHWFGMEQRGSLRAWPLSLILSA